MPVRRRLHTMRPCLAGVPHQLLDVELPCSRVSLRAGASRHQRKRRRRIAQRTLASGVPRSTRLRSPSARPNRREWQRRGRARDHWYPAHRAGTGGKTPTSRTRAATPSTPPARLYGTGYARRTSTSEVRRGQRSTRTPRPVSEDARAVDGRPADRSDAGQRREHRKHRDTGTAPVGPVNVAPRNNPTEMARPPRSSDRATDRTSCSAPRTPEAPRARPPPPWAQ